MIRPRFGSRDFSRRAFERISIIVIEPVSSTQIGAFISLSQAAVRRGQSSGFSLPVRRLCDSTFASLHIIRCVTSLFDISSVKSATGTSCRTARFCAMFSASADFPIEGRAAMMIRLPGWKPEVSLSSSLKPVGQPVTSAPASYRCMIRSKLSFSRPSMWVKSLGDALLGEVEDDLLGAVDEVGRLAGPLLPEPRDLRPGPDEAAQRRHLAHDARVVGGVRRRRHERRELVDRARGRRRARARRAPRARRRA